MAHMTVRTSQENISYNYFGYIFSRLRREQDESLPAIMGIVPKKDGTLSLAYNPKYFPGTSDANIKKIVEHEGMHVLNKHVPRLLRVLANEINERQKTFKMKAWNIAADSAVNPAIDFPRMFLLAGKEFHACFPDYYGFEPNRATEEYYFKLLEQAKKNKQKCPNCGKPQKGDQEKGEKQPDNGTPQPGESEGEPQSGEGQPHEENPQSGEGECCSCGHGETPGTHAKWGDVEHETSDLNSLSRKIDSQVQDIVKSAVKNFKDKRGTLPAHMQQLVDDMLNPPKIPYFELIKKLVKGSRHSKFKRSLTTVNRKRTYAFIIDEENIPSISPFPGKTRDFSFNIVVIIDTSGSMDIKDVKEGLSGCKNIIEKDRHCLLTVLECDAKLQKEYVIKKIDDIDFKIKGRGGTILREALERAKELNPDITLVFTDGGCDNINLFSKKDLPKKIIWVIQKSGTADKVDRTGIVVRIDD